MQLLSAIGVFADDASKTAVTALEPTAPYESKPHEIAMPDEIDPSFRPGSSGMEPFHTTACASLRLENQV